LIPMGQHRPPKPVKLIVGMLSQQATLFDLAQQRMQTLWGAIDIHSEVMPFNYTDYYESQMGQALLRKFVGFAELIDPAQLAAIKHQSDRIETAFSQMPEGRQLGVTRPINLDPGYIEPSKLVLASTKNYSHRIYIGDSMYAECTLHFHKGKWCGWPFSYPDYTSGNYDSFLTRARHLLMEQLSSRKENT
jgi:hypothetical protein